jgi:hypothetical protein
MVYSLNRLFSSLFLDLGGLRWRSTLKPDEPFLRSLRLESPASSALRAGTTRCSGLVACLGVHPQFQEFPVAPQRHRGHRGRT